MDYHSELTDIIEHMPEETARIAIKIGKRRDQLRHVTNIYPPIADGNIIDILEEHGFGTSCQFARLWFYDSNKLKLQSKSLTQPIEPESSPPNDIGYMVEGILMTMAEMRRFITVQNESINTLVSRQSDMMLNLFESKEEVMAERAAAIGLDMELQAVKDEIETSYKTQAIKAVSQAAQTFAESYNGNISPEKIANLILSNPEYIDYALTNEELLNLFAQKIAEKSILK